MAEWAWVTAGYGVVYAAMATYVAVLVRRQHLARRRLPGRSAPQEPGAQVAADRAERPG